MHYAPFQSTATPGYRSTNILDWSLLYLALVIVKYLQQGPSLLQNFGGDKLCVIWMLLCYCAYNTIYNIIVCVPMTSPCSLSRSTTFFAKLANWEAKCGNDIFKLTNTAINNYDNSVYIVNLYNMPIIGNPMIMSIFLIYFPALCLGFSTVM